MASMQYTVFYSENIHYTMQQLELSNNDYIPYYTRKKIIIRGQKKKQHYQNIIISKLKIVHYECTTKQKYIIDARALMLNCL